MPTSTNRTKWPIHGGAISLQPGWFPGHSRAMIYMNLGLGTVPPNMSHPMKTPFGIVGPDNDPYPGTICIPQVPLPAGIEVSPGDNATIQVIELAQHGAALYNVCCCYPPVIGLVRTVKSNFDLSSAWTSHSPSRKRLPKSTEIIVKTPARSPSKRCSPLRRYKAPDSRSSPHLPSSQPSYRRFWLSRTVS